MNGEQATPPANKREADGGTWETDPLIGGMVGGRYRVRSIVGRGGMGIVYDALHEELGRPVAIKVVSSAHAHDTKVIDRFLREARVVAQIGHPNIVDVHDLGRLEDQRPYLVMERLYGPSFYELLQLHGRMAPERVAELLEGAGAALEVVHSKGIIHRDIKLENLMLARLEDGTQVVKLLDFGIAAFSQHAPDAKRITAQGMITGTPLYIAPESASGDRPDHRADIYSLAVVAYMMLTGFAPFDSENPVMVLLKKLSEPPPKLSSSSLRFSQVIEDVIARGLARSRDDRYQSARDFVRDIRNAAHGPGAEVLTGDEAESDVARVRELERPSPSPSSPRVAEAAMAELALVMPGPLDRSTPKVVKVEIEEDEATVPGPEPEDEEPIPLTTPTGEIVNAGLGRRPDSVRRFALYLLPLVLAIGAWLGLNRARAPLIEAVPVEAALAPHRAEVNAAPDPEPRVAEPVQAIDPSQQAVVERVAVTEIKKGEPNAAKLDAAAERLAEEFAKGEAAKKEATARSEATAAAVEAAKRRPIREQAPPKVTVPAADVAKAEQAAQEGMKALIGGRLPSAIESFREATNAAPRYAPAWRGLGLANEKLGRKSEALDAFEQYLRLSSSEDARVVREVEQRVEKLRGI